MSKTQILGGPRSCCKVQHNRPPTSSIQSRCRLSSHRPPSQPTATPSQSWRSDTSPSTDVPTTRPRAPSRPMLSVAVARNNRSRFARPSARRTWQRDAALAQARTVLVPRSVRLPTVTMTQLLQNLRYVSYNCLVIPHNKIDIADQHVCAFCSFSGGGNHRWTLALRATRPAVREQGPCDTTKVHPSPHLISSIRIAAFGYLASSLEGQQHHPRACLSASDSLFPSPSREPLYTSTLQFISYLPSMIMLMVEKNQLSSLTCRHRMLQLFGDKMLISSSCPRIFLRWSRASSPTRSICRFKLPPDSANSCPRSAILLSKRSSRLVSSAVSSSSSDPLTPSCNLRPHGP